MNMEIGYRLLCLLLCTVCNSNGAKILGIFPTASSSHQLTYHPLMKALASRGHEVTVITSYSLKTSVSRYTEIDMSFSYKYDELDFSKMEKASFVEIVSLLIPYMANIADAQLSSRQVQEIIRSANNTTYDLVFLEVWLYQAYYGLIHHIGSPPIIGIFPTLGATAAMQDAMGMISNPSYMPTSIFNYDNHMSFYERLHNTIFWIWMRYITHNQLYPIHDEIVRKHFGSTVPSVYELEKRTDLFMIGTNWLFEYPHPMSPAVIYYHSLHMENTPDHLSKDLQKYLDEAEHGIIYLSFGSHILSTGMEVERREMFVEVLSELPQKVIWKWESDTLPGKPENVKIGKWLPQRTILAHPNVKLFISHCGMHSFQEAVFYAVPIVGIPIWADHIFNSKKIDITETGITFGSRELTKETLRHAINEVLQNSKYKKNMEKLSVLFRDEPETSLEKLIWWTEHVLRHKGAKHLRSGALDLQWHQYLLLDIITFVFLLIVILSLILYYFFKLICKFVIKNMRIKSKYD